MKILYVIKTTNNGCNYYNDTICALQSIAEVKLCVCSHKISEKNKDFNADCVIVGFDVTDCGNSSPGFNIVNDTNIPLYVILNKEYTGLDAKLMWIKLQTPRICFTVHHDYKKYTERILIPFQRIMWSAREDIFKKYDDIYKYDMFFSGVVRKEQTQNLRKRVFEHLDKLDNYVIQLNISIFENDKMIKQSPMYSNEEYAYMLSVSKICFITTGPADLVGTRYFEVSASNKAMILCNRMSNEVYGDFLIDKFNCVMFDDEADCIEKFKYYISHEEERKTIVHNAYLHFINKHTWKHHMSDMLQVIKNDISKSQCLSV